MGRLQLTDEQRAQVAATGRPPVLTPEQLEDSFADAFVIEAFTYGLQYYGAARFGFAAGFLPVPATLMHHAAETFLQGCLAVRDTPAQIHRYAKVYRGHRLPDLWAPLKQRYPDAGLPAFDTTIDVLERFREVRFPDNIAEFGVNLNVMFADLPPPAGDAALPVAPDRVFTLDMRPVDRLVVKLFDVAEINPRFFDSLLRHPEGGRYFALRNEAPL
jgi:hypothetical protein